MPFLIAMDLLAGSQVPFRYDVQPLSDPIPLEISHQRVRNLDPVARATELASSLSRQWCGAFQTFDGSPAVNVTLGLTSLKAIGQMVDLRGEITVGSVTTPIQGNLHAKSDQLDLIPLGNPLIMGVEPGGIFLGLQGFNLMGWQSPRLAKALDPSTKLGGRLELADSCQTEMPTK
ncbi:hypothetical protein CREGCYN_02590 [Synechococcus sp. M16CYN]